MHNYHLPLPQLIIYQHDSCTIVSKNVKRFRGEIKLIEVNIAFCYILLLLPQLWWSLNNYHTTNLVNIYRYLLFIIFILYFDFIIKNIIEKMIIIFSILCILKKPIFWYWLYIVPLFINIFFCKILYSISDLLSYHLTWKDTYYHQLWNSNTYTTYSYSAYKIFF